MCLPYMKLTPNYTRDSDHVILAAKNVKVRTEHLLVSFDWVNLYPKLNHLLICVLLRRFLTRNGCPYVNFICAAVQLTPAENY